LVKFRQPQRRIVDISTILTKIAKYRNFKPALNEISATIEYKPMIELFSNLTEEQANTITLVLLASNIFYRMDKTGDTWIIFVREEDHKKALYCTYLYLKENKPNQTLQLPEKKTKYYLLPGIFAVLFLQLFHALANKNFIDASHIQLFKASALHILDGEIYRTVTALTLHANLMHLANNAIAIIIFAPAVCSFSGYGAGWFMILLSGVFGNYLNALFYQTGHVSIGSSTAVFGALGILSAYRSMEKQKGTGLLSKAWIPIAGGVALLAFLGTSGEKI